MKTPLLDSLIADFGGNYAFALDLLADYERDRGSVEPSWREYFDRMTGARPEPQGGDGQLAGPRPAPPESPGAASPPAGATGSDVATRPFALTRSEPTAGARSKALVVPAI